MAAERVEQLARQVHLLLHASASRVLLAIHSDASMLHVVWLPRAAQRNGRRAVEDCAPDARAAAGCWWLIRCTDMT
jgi:hypothetical protein